MWSTRWRRTCEGRFKWNRTSLTWTHDLANAAIINAYYSIRIQVLINFPWVTLLMDFVTTYKFGNLANSTQYKSILFPNVSVSIAYTLKLNVCQSKLVQCFCSMYVVLCPVFFSIITSIFLICLFLISIVLGFNLWHFRLFKIITNLDQEKDSLQTLI